MTEPEPDLSNKDLRVEFSDDDLEIRVTLDRPEQQNATNERMMDGLMNVLEVADDSSARVVVIRGAEGTFCSGGDLGGMGKEGPPTASDRREQAAGLSELYDQLITTDALTLAAVEGYCLAGGLGLASGCEFVLAEQDATFGLPEVNVGMFPMQAMSSIARTIPEREFHELAFTGEFVGADQAADMGLVNEVIHGESFDKQLGEFVDTLVNNSPTTIAMGKEAYYQQREMTFTEAHRYLADMLALLMMTDDHQEGIEAFQEKRDPAWTAR